MFEFLEGKQIDDVKLRHARITMILAVVDKTNCNILRRPVSACHVDVRIRISITIHLYTELTSFCINRTLVLFRQNGKRVYISIKMHPSK